jgi:CysZ protein
MIQAAFLALRQALSRPLRIILLKAIGLALLLLFVFGLGFEWLIARLIQFSNENVDLIATVLASLGVVAGLIFLVPPVTSLMAGIFLDEVAEQVEQRHYPQDPPGRAMAILPSLWLSARFFLVVVAVNLVVLALLFVPGVNLAAYLVGNGYLLGREYFSFAALRFRSEADAAALRKRHGLTVFLGGVLIALFAAIPIVNLATPIVAAAFMVHIYKRVSRREGGAVQPPELPQRSAT